MTLELFSTSVPSGLEPGRSGFCTVAMTRTLSRPLVEALEALSSYRPVFLPTDPRADENPVTVSYLRVSVAGRNYYVVSRICFAGLDYTNRSNRFAHHVVLDVSDPRPPGGPAWLAARPGFLETKFDGQIQYRPAGRAIPAAAPPSAACPTWQKLTGDAGWAGVLAEALANPTARSFFLVYDLGTPVLALIQEAIGLLPPERRWEATFTTYFTGLPAGVVCTVRGVLRGSAEAASAQGAASLDLGKLAGKTPPVNEWTQAARAGKAIASRQVHVNAPMPMKPGMPPSPAQLAAPQPLAPLPFADYREEPNPFGSDEPRRERSPKKGGVGKYVVLTLLASVVFLGGGVGAVAMLRPDLFERKTQVVENGGEKDKTPPIEDKDKTGKDSDKGKGGAKTKLVATLAEMTITPPLVGKPATLHVTLSYPKGGPKFPFDKLRITLDGKELSAKAQADGAFELTFPKSGPQNLLAEYAGDEQFEKVSIPLSVKVLMPLPKFTVEVKPTKAKRGDRIEVSVKGLPKEFTGFGKIGLIGPGDDSKATRSDGKKPIVLTGLKPGTYSIKATFPGDDTFAGGESSNAVEVRIQRTPVFDFKAMSSDTFSRGKIDIQVTVKGTEKGEQGPKGTLQLKYKDQLIEGAINAKGAVTLSKEGLDPGIYELTLCFTPDDKDTWATIEEPLKGTWRVIPTVRVNVDPEESTPKEARRDKDVRFKVSSGHAECRELPPGKRFFLRFLPSPRAVKGTFEPHLELSDTGQAKLVVRWRPGKDSWGMAKPINNAPAFPVITLVVADTVEKADKKLFDHALKYTLNNRFPPARGDNNEVYIPLVPAFREVIASLHGAEIEVYEGFDVTLRSKDAKGKVSIKTTRKKEDWVSANLAGTVLGNGNGVLSALVIGSCARDQSPIGSIERQPGPALPLLRLKLYDKR